MKPKNNEELWDKDAITRFEDLTHGEYSTRLKFRNSHFDLFHFIHSGEMEKNDGTSYNNKRTKIR